MCARDEPGNGSSISAASLSSGRLPHEAHSLDAANDWSMTRYCDYLHEILSPGMGPGGWVVCRFRRAEISFSIQKESM